MEAGTRKRPNTFGCLLGRPWFLRVVLAGAFALGTSAAQATIRYVNSSRPDDSGDGLSWAAAEKTLQAALAIAISGDEIWVVAGTYTPDQGPGQTPGDRSATFQLIDGVAVYCGFNGTETLLSQRDPATNVTLLSCDLNGDDGPALFEDNDENCNHVVVSSGGTLDGCTISGGHADTPEIRGAGVYLQDSDSTITACKFVNNKAVEGGAIYNQDTNSTITNCTFTGNNAVGAGGAIFNESNTSPRISNCIFDGNTATNAEGGAMFNAVGNAIIRQSLFIANSALAGGAVFNSEASATFANCSFLGNTTTQFFGGAAGNTAGAAPTFINCLFSGNIAADAGGAIGADDSLVTVINSTFSRNSAALSGGGIFNAGATVNLRNCIFSENADGGGVDESAQIHQLFGTVTVNYSLVTGLTGALGGTGNIGGDPLFADFNGPNNILGDEDDDLKPLDGSPCIDAGNNSFVPADTADLDDDANLVEPTPIDFDGNPRFIDDPLRADTGSGTPPIVDMGAYEQEGLLFVDASANGLNNGSSWVNAFNNLQTALAVATPGTEIWVAAIPNGGAYKPAGLGGLRSATFQLESGVALYGGFAGGEDDRNLRDPANNETILSGDLNGDDTDVPCTVNSPDCDSFGGLCDGGFCIIAFNNAENSYHVVTGSGTDATAILDGFVITAANASDFPNDWGGGMINDAGSPTVADCAFRRNRAGFNGGGMSNVSGSNPTVTGCAFTGNWADNGGGGMNTNASNPLVTNCTFNRNYAAGGGGMGVTSGSIPVVTGCTFTENLAGGGGGIHSGSSGNYAVTNCTFTGNLATNGDGMWNTFSAPTVVNSILWANGGADELSQIENINSTPTVNYSIIQGWTGALGGTGNSGADPLFVNPGANDLRLQSGSPAIDAADTTALPLDTYDLDGDLSTTEDISLDLGGNPRVLDGVVDMGAYEYFPDCDGGGVPDVCDLDCGPADGPCDIPGCGDCLDCNGNDVPDACDIADATSNDCNLNGVPDLCDVPSSVGCPTGSCVSGCSLDLNQDCVPDECAVTTGTGGTPDWNDGTNWTLSGSFPDDSAGVADQHVTLEGSLILNISVEIDSLQIDSGVTLDVTGGDLLIADEALQTAGITPPPKLKLSLEGEVAVANGYDVTVVGDSVAVNNGGLYHAAAITDSALSAEDIAVYAGGEISLEHSMTMTSSGAIILDGSEATMPVPCIPFAGAGDAPLGITPPPKLRLADNVDAYALGSVVMTGAVEVIVDSTQPVELGGDFDNRSVVPHVFDWTAGKLTLNGALPQAFEVAGINIGQTSDGFLTDEDSLSDTCQHTNYSMGTVEVASVANVTFANEFANTVSTGCGEALYVHNLTFQSGATVTIDNCKVYYDTLADNGVTPTVIGCGELLSTIPPTTPDGDPSNVNRNRGLVLSIPGPNTAGPGALTALRVALVELQNPVPPNLPANPPPDFSTYEFASTCTDPGGCVRWIGEPKVFLESQDSPGSGNFMAARLQCTPLYRDWTTAGFFYVVGAEITPSSKYDVHQFAQTCTGRESSCTAVSATLPITTARSGDVEEPFNPPSTSTQPDVTDVAQLVNKFKNLAGALPKATTQLQPNVPELNADINALDIVAVVDAVKQKAYGFGGPCPCPSTVTCGSTACSSVTPCVTAFGAGATCVKTCTGPGPLAGDSCINNTHCVGSGACGSGFCRDRCGRCNP